MNSYIDAQILNMVAITRTFTQSCTMAARKDNGAIDREEQRLLTKIEKASARFIQELEATRR